MKLPEDRNERIKLFALIGLMAAFLLYFLIGSAVRPLLRTKAEREESITKLKGELETARKVMDFVTRSQEVNRQVVGEIVEIAEVSNCVLKARLGNYLLEATEIIERQAAAAGVPVASVKEMGIADAPASKNPAANVFRLYSVRVDAECGLHDLIRLIGQIEQSNPYASITGVAISEQASTPAEHEINFNVQWPIWKDDHLLEEIKKRAEVPGDEK